MGGGQDWVGGAIVIVTFAGGVLGWWIVDWIKSFGGRRGK